ncbi:MAG: TonB-dependent receptor [Gemmatimonadaceae bacterium]|nr:TonB-dependent receptor [Gemmatimonadaceae bacterium]NUS95779.1 TonB-dependent receptor [Gemmatimonadaceae bacterium]
MQPSLRRALGVALASTALQLAPTTPAAAQTTAADSIRADSVRADSVRRARPTTLAPVRVTALGGSLAPGRVPYAVAVQGASAAAELKAPLAIDEPLRGIPGLAVDNRYNIALGERITIRGFGARTQFGVRGIHVDVDGVPATMPDGQTTLSHVDAGTIATTEALRGPASSLYGNSAGGAVLLRTWAHPVTGLDARGSASIAERGTTTSRLELGGSSGGWSAAARASALDYRGYRVHSDARDVRGGARVAHAASRDTLALSIATANYDADNPGGLTDSARTADPRSASATNLRFRTGEVGVHRQAGLSWRHAADAWTLDASAWGLGRRVDNPIPQRIIDLRRRAGGARASVESRALADGRVTLGAGVEHGTQIDDRRAYGSLNGVRGATQLDQLEHVNGDGVYLRAAVAPLEKLSVLGAVRGDRVAFHVDDRLVSATDPDDGGSRTMRAISPSLGASWSWTNRFSTYANVGTAFETPTTTELANRPSGAGGMNPDLSPQRIVSTEIGVRAPAASTGSLTLAVFDARIRDALVPYELASAPGRQFYRNASRASHRGAEGSISSTVGTWGLARVAATLLDARFRATDTTAGLEAGKRIPGIAPFRADVSFAAGLAGPLRAELIVAAQSRTPVNDANTFWSPGFAVVNVALSARDRIVGPLFVTAGLFVTNLSDRRFDTSVVPNAARDRYFEPGPPRTVTVTLDIAPRGARR